jgi:RND superfamily putative drug exporter
VFALLYGMSMDYEVFITSRIREEYDVAGDTNHAVVQGLAHTGRLVTSASLILFFAFAALAAGPEVDIKVLATGLAAGILLDATIIRALLVPAIVSLLGKWNWYLPDTATKLLRVNPSRGRVNPPPDVDPRHPRAAAADRIRSLADPTGELWRRDVEPGPDRPNDERASESHA